MKKEKKVDKKFVAKLKTLAFSDRTSNREKWGTK